MPPPGVPSAGPRRTGPWVPTGRAPVCAAARAAPCAGAWCWVEEGPPRVSLRGSLREGADTCDGEGAGHPLPGGKSPRDRPQPRSGAEPAPRSRQSRPGTPARGERERGQGQAGANPCFRVEAADPPPLLLITPAWIFSPRSLQPCFTGLGFAFLAPLFDFGGAPGGQHPESHPRPCRRARRGDPPGGGPRGVLCRGRCCSAEGCQPSLCGSAASSPTPRSLCGPQLLLDLVQQ